MKVVLVSSVTLTFATSSDPTPSDTVKAAPSARALPSTFKSISVGAALAAAFATSS